MYFVKRLTFKYLSAPSHLWISSVIEFTAMRGNGEMSHPFNVSVS